MLRWLLVSWFVNAVALGVAGWLLGDMTFHGSGWTVVWSAAVFGVLNTILKPILKFVTAPIALLTLGLAWFFVAMFMLWLTQLIIGGFDMHGFWTYVWATVIVWAVNVVLDALFRRDDWSGSRVTAAV